jgi:N-acetyl-gamma-glutamyl-phosphate reductase
VNRGILCSCYLKLLKDLTAEDARSLYREFYSKAPFVRVMKEGEWPDTKYVSGSNCCDIGMEVLGERGEMVVVSAIDNLVKGAAGQAVQNMNIMCGFDERKGLL